MTNHRPVTSCGDPPWFNGLILLIFRGNWLDFLFKKKEVRYAFMFQFSLKPIQPMPVYIAIVVVVVVVDVVVVVAVVVVVVVKQSIILSDTCVCFLTGVRSMFIDQSSLINMLTTMFFFFMITVVIIIVVSNIYYDSRFNFWNILDSISEKCNI